MKIDKNKVVSVSYELRLNEETAEVAEKTTEEKPLKFVFGTGMMLEKFEEQLNGLEQGNEFQFKLPHKDAYGELNEQAIMDLPIDIFKMEGELNTDVVKTGNTLPMRDTQGNEFEGKVLEVGDSAVKMDFNHPLAGVDLFFTGKIEGVREASDDELDSGQPED